MFSIMVGNLKVTWRKRESTADSDYLDNALVREKDNWVNELRLKLISKPTVKRLIEVKVLNEIGYKDLLDCYEWKYLRLQILKRDKYTCQKCFKRDFILDIHHKYYLKDKLPWEIDNDGLVALCPDCHKLEHAQNVIKIYKKTGDEFVEIENANFYCPRCNGSGYFKEYRHVENGICFLCWGSKINRTIFSVRLSWIKTYPNSYPVNQLVYESYQFLHNTEIDFYVEVIKKMRDELPCKNRLSEEVSPGLDDDLPF